MIHRYTKCPGIGNIQSILTSIFLEQDAGIVEADQEQVDPSAETIFYKQWTVTERSELVTQSSSVEEFIEKVCEKLDMIISHSYVAKSQAECLKNLKL